MALDNDHFKLSQAIQRETRSIHEVVTSMGSGEDERQRESILNWLFTEDYFAHHLYFSRMRQLGTGDWFIDSVELQTWFAVPKHTVFCPGDPGTGKTMLVSRVIDHLNDLQELDVAYVYCNYKRHQQQNAYAILSALLKQLIWKLSPLPTAVIDLYKKYSAKNATPSVDEVSITLSQVLGENSPVFLILDALDECDTTNDVCNTVLSKLRALQSMHDVRLLFTSRPLPDIQRKFIGDSVVTIRAADSDINLFLDSEVPQLRIVRRHSQLAPLIKTRILNSINGMFLLARIYLEALKHKWNREAVQSTLANISKNSSSLNDVYEDTLKRIDSQSADDQRLAQLTLSWITISSEILHLRELQHALAAALGSSALDEADMLEVDDILSVCAGLVTFNADNGVIGFAHYTMQEYFRDRILTWLPNALVDMTLTCLGYVKLVQPFLTKIPKDFVEALKQIWFEFPFLCHALKQWGNYFRPIQEDESVTDAVCQFIESFKSFNAIQDVSRLVYIMRVLGLNSELSFYYIYFAPIHLAAYFGLSRTMDVLLQQNQNWSADMVTHMEIGRYSSRPTPLCTAIMNEHEGVVRYLIGRLDVDVNRQITLRSLGAIEEDWTPLHIAVAVDQYSIAEMLLKHPKIKADIQVGETGNGSTALFFAASRCRSRIVALLLGQKEIKINAMFNNKRQSALHIATSGGKRKVVELLLQSPDLDVNLQDGSGQTALVVAARRGNEEIAKLLLAHPNIDINEADDARETPLFHCCFYGNEAIAKLLVAREDCNINAKK